MPGRHPWSRGALPRALSVLLLCAALPAGPAAAAPGPAATAPGSDGAQDASGTDGATAPDADDADADDADADDAAGPDEETAAEAPEAAATERSAARVLGELRTLYQRIGAAEESSRVTTERLRGQQRRVARVSEELAETRTRLAENRAVAGQLAREEYRNGGMRFSPALRVVLAGPDEDPLGELHRQTVLDRAGDRTAATVRELRAEEERAGVLAERSRTALDTEQALAGHQAEQEREVRERVGEAEALLASLSGPELDDLADLERLEAAEAARELATDGTLAPDGGDPAPSAAGRTAVAHALGHVDGTTEDADSARADDGAAADRGSRLGAVVSTALAAVADPTGIGEAAAGRADAGDGGPGLVARSWARAGQRLPSTSRGQWESLERVELSELRPGDVVIHFPDATRSALYVGDGMVVREPYPGATAALVPLTVHPVLGAVRPDPRAPAATDRTE
ncbi:glycoside hydrolase [Streptomyces otsuchiensis]|uniref:glycoside hydrolase n=1 Tax=Streptomyces otsuchiensis TaxID=2681388 RepID=UPI001031B513|nr:glycoside hydrolase [Streptomyces otsuchiensis]